MSAVIFGPNSSINLATNGGILDQATGRLRTDNGPKNYIGFNNFENQLTTGWTLGVTGTLTNGLPTGTPTFGSGASGTLAIAVVTSGQLAGTASLSYADSAITTAGNMVASSALTIDIEDQAKVLSWKFAYKAQTNPTNGNWSGTSSNSFAVAVYDVTNSAWLTSAGNFNLVQSTGVGICTGTCQTNATTASLRFVIYNANATAGAITMYFDDFYLGPQTSPIAPVMTDWVAYTPTFVGLGTPSNILMYSRRVGSDLEFQGQFQVGTTTGVTATMSLGYNGANANVVADTTRHAANNVIGSATVGQNSTTFFDIAPIMPASSVGTISFAAQTSTTNESSGAILGTVITSSSTMTVIGKVPIVGWSSNSVVSADTDTRVISFSGSQTSQAVTANVTDIGFTTILDRAGAWSGTQYIVPVAGDYVFSASAIVSASGSLVTYKNTVAAGVLGAQNTAALNAVGTFLHINCKAGDILSVRCTTSITLTSGSISVFRLSGPAVITATESVNARYFGATATVTGSFSNVTYSTKDYDSHNAYSGATYTVPVSGKYSITASLIITAASTHQTGLEITVNGVDKREIYTPNGPTGTATGTSSDLVIEDQLSCNAGDTIVIKVLDSGTTPTVSASNVRNVFTIARVGN